MTQNSLVTFQFPGEGGQTLVTVSSTAADGDVDDAVASRERFEDVTDQYELAVEGARALTVERGTVGTTLVVFPTGTGTTIVLVNFNNTGRYRCRDAARAVQQHLVESVRGL